MINHDNYAINREWSDQCIPIIKQIIGPYLLGVAPIELDVKEATDLITLMAEPVQIACRVRRPGYDEKYPNEVTFRSFARYAKTEWEKITEDGYADWFFYGHANHAEQPTGIIRWFLLDLHVIRFCLRNYPELAGWVEFNKSNGDGTRFNALSVPAFYHTHPNVVIAASHPIDRFHAMWGCRVEYEAPKTKLQIMKEKVSELQNQVLQLQKKPELERVKPWLSLKIQQRFDFFKEAA